MTEGKKNPAASQGRNQEVVRWLKEPAKHDYPAAASYLSLTLSPKKVKDVLAALKAVETGDFKAKDLLRATGLPLLPADDPDVAKELGRIRAGTALSPCLVLRGQQQKRRPGPDRRRLPPGLRFIPRQRRHGRVRAHRPILGPAP